LPTAGGTVYVRLWSNLGTSWEFNDYAYAASSAGGGGTTLKAAMTSPANGSALSGACATFAWGAGGLSQYHLQVGSTVGGTNYFNSNVGGSRSQQVCSLPVTGVAVYVRLYTNTGSSWEYNDYSYTASSSGGGTAARIELTSPVNGAALPGACSSFAWTTPFNGITVHLQVGSNAGGTDYFNQNLNNSRFATVCNLPTAGQAVYVRLWSNPGGIWSWIDYSFRAFR
jgi:hypothetical protein